MFAYLASAALLAGGALTCGGAISALCGRGAADAAAPAAGLAALLILAGLAAAAGAGQALIGIALIGIVLLAGTILVLSGPAPTRARARRAFGGATIAALLALAAASIPFLVAGAVGILGVGLVNDDMASHLLIADWIREGFTPEPVLIDQGYPLGPHAVVAGLGWLLDARTIDVFAGLNAAIVVLAAITAHRLLAALSRPLRVIVAVLVSLPYLAAAYVAQEAFKEPIMALFVIAFAVALVRPPAGSSPAVRFIPAAVVVAGTLFVYSFPGLVWLGLTAALAALAGLVRARGRGERPADALRAAALPVGLGLLVIALIAAADLGRLLDFSDFRALDPDRANEGGLGNLRGHISPLEAFGIWPSGEFRLSAAASSLPSALFLLGGLVGLAAFLAGLPGWLRRHGPAIPMAILAAAVVYAGARGFGTVYTSAKALAIASPAIMLVALGGLFDRGPADPAPAPATGRPRRRLVAARPLALALGALLALGAAGSSLLVLRAAPVGPEAHMRELDRIRPLVAGKPLLFLGRDNFVLWELRGSRPFTHVRNFYDPYFVRPNFELENVGSKFDFDSVDAGALSRFPFVLTTRAAYASGPPPEFTAVLVTDSYVLWERTAGEPIERSPGEADAAPVGDAACGEPPRDASRVALFAAEPVLVPASEWTPGPDPRGGASSRIELDLPAGSWNLSLPYDATHRLRLSAPGLDAMLPANLDYRGTSPFWHAGTIEVTDPGPVTITAEVDAPAGVGRLLGADSVAHLGDLAATRAGPSTAEGLEPDQVAPGAGAELTRPQPRALCEEPVDWTEPSSRGR